MHVWESNDSSEERAACGTCDRRSNDAHVEPPSEQDRVQSSQAGGADAVEETREEEWGRVRSADTIGRGESVTVWQVPRKAWAYCKFQEMSSRVSTRERAA